MLYTIVARTVRRNATQRVTPSRYCVKDGEYDTVVVEDVDAGGYGGVLFALFPDLSFVFSLSLDVDLSISHPSSSSAFDADEPRSLFLTSPLC